MSRLLTAAVVVMVVLAVAFTEVLAVFMAVAFVVALDTLSAAFVVTRVFMAVNFAAIASASVRVWARLRAGWHWRRSLTHHFMQTHMLRRM
ncbi:MAG TPA: hypothetical protein VGC70_16215 [Burkholderiales bacterium]|jgi:hypothetical protein